MRFSVLFFLPLLVNACSDDDKTIRCMGSSQANAWANTEACARELGNKKDCFCVHRAWYFMVANDNFQDFVDCCSRKGYGYREC